MKDIFDINTYLNGTHVTNQTRIEDTAIHEFSNREIIVYFSAFDKTYYSSS